MATPAVLDREEYVEQAYFFRLLRERMAGQMAAQDVLGRLHEEILSTTRLPYAIQFLATEMKHSGLLSSGFARLSHYFTPFQTFVVSRTEQEGLRFGIETALLVLEREAQYRAGEPTAAGLFVYQFETLSRNRLGYERGLVSMAGDPFYGPDWKEYIDLVRLQAGTIDFADLVYVRSRWYVLEKRRAEPGYEPPVPALFGEKEGKIAKASVGRDPLFLFAALQRQLGYPEVPRARPRDDVDAQLEALRAKLKQMEQRLMLLESEVRGQVDLSQFGKPELLSGPAAGDEPV
jgi:hypothetical protein